jgi:DNA-binding transcriptional MerR regulator
MAGLKIGEVARLAGVTTRAVRHYHAIGLLPEPRRSASGYRLYGEGDLIALVRVARMRELGVPTSRIRSGLTAGAVELGGSLRALADEIDEDIARLTQTRDRLRELADRDELDDPARRYARGLGEHGLLQAGRGLPAGEAEAARLVDALHPEGIAGALRDADVFLADRGTRARLDDILRRFRGLDEEVDDARIDDLAREITEILPRPEGAAPPADFATMDALVGDRLNRPQREVLRRMRLMLLEERRRSGR